MFYFAADEGGETKKDGKNEQKCFSGKMQLLYLFTPPIIVVPSHKR